jgi:hypothetical protein
MSLLAYVANGWYALNAVDGREAPCLVILSTDAQASSGVMIPVDRQPAIVGLDAEVEGPEAAGAVTTLVINVAGLPPEPIAFKASTFLEKAAATAKSGAQAVDLTPDVLADWGEIGDEA